MNKQTYEPGKKKILVIDDDVDVTNLIEKTLELTREYQVIVVNDPAKAVGLARKYKPDVILLDAVMPGTNGIEIATQLSMENQLLEVPVIFISSLLDKKDTGKSGKRIGDYMCLAKPFMPKDLLTCVEKVERVH